MVNSVARGKDNIQHYGKAQGGKRSPTSTFLSLSINCFPNKNSALPKSFRCLANHPQRKSFPSLHSGMRQLLWPTNMGAWSRYNLINRGYLNRKLEVEAEKSSYTLCGIMIDMTNRTQDEMAKVIIFKSESDDWQHKYKMLQIKYRKLLEGIE